MQCNLCSISCAVGVNVVTLWSFHNYFSFCVVTFHQCENQTCKSSNKAHFQSLMNKSPARFRAETLKQLASPRIAFSSLMMMMMMLQSEQHLRKWSFWEHVKDFHAKHVRSLPAVCTWMLGQRLEKLLNSIWKTWRVAWRRICFNTQFSRM